MSLSLSANFITKQNSVLPLAQSSLKAGLAVRVASNGTDVLGTLTAIGAASTTVNWSITQNPSWVTISPDATSLVLTISFSNAQAQVNPYQFFVSCTDGATTTYFPVLLEVRDPFAISPVGGGTTFSIPSYDSTVADIVFQGVGLNGAIEAGISFIPPASLPSGLEFVTSDESQMILRVAPSTSSNLSGGLALYTGSPSTTQITLQAYKPGTMYDNPDRCFTQEFAIASLTAKPGTLDVALAVAWDTTLSAFSLRAAVDFLNGLAPSVTYEWDVTGTASGTITAGGTSTDTTMTWVPTGAGLVSFTFKVKDATSGTVLGQQIVSPAVNGVGLGIPTATPGVWTSTAAVKVAISSQVTRGFIGDTATVSVSTPAGELSGGETIHLTLSIVAASNLESPITLSSSTAVLTAGAPSATIPVTFPSSTLNEKWILQVVAANATSSPTRTGYAEAVFESNGKPVMTINVGGGPSLSSSTGSPLVGVTLGAFNSASALISNASFSLLGAPDGLFINSNELVGNALKPGVYTFQVIADATGYARSLSSVQTLTVAQASVPLQITDAVPSVASLPDGTQFTVNWGLVGVATVLNLIQNFTVRNALGITQATTSQVGPSVIAVYGQSFYGDAYSIPALVLSSSTTALGNLLNAPTIGLIDENFNLTLNWQPLQVDGSYSIYKAFNIWLSAPLATPTLQTVNGYLPTGLEIAGSTPGSRLFEELLSAGDWVVTMQALSNDYSIAQNAASWDQPHQFPKALTPSTFSFDNGTVSIGQTVTLTLDPNYVGAGSWCAFYPDGTDSGWLPLSIRTTAKAFAAAGSMPIIIQTQNDFSAANPGVKLRRQVTKTLYVQPQQFNPGGGNNGLIGDLGLGGVDGFEVIGAGSGPGADNYAISDASTRPTLLNPYEVVVRALVRDTLTNELKLMVATARTADASSLLGTMAMDVFPILGRPRIKELINPALFLSPEQVVAGNPVRISTTALPSVIVGKPMSDFAMQAATNSGVAPLSWYADTLPAGLSMAINGTISGVPTEIGTLTVDVVVMDGNSPPFIAVSTLSMTVETDLRITTTSLPQAVVGTPYNTPIVFTGGLPPYVWAIVSGTPPTGITIDPATGVLIGVPVTYNSTKDFSKTYSFTVQVTDAIGAVASTALTCTLAPAALGFGTLDQTTIFAGETFRMRVPIYGGRSPYQLSSITDDGVISIGPSIINPDAISAVAGLNPATLAITTSDQQIFPQAYPATNAFVLSATGGTAPYEFSVLPGVLTTLPGASINGNLLTMAPTYDGAFSVQVQVLDSLGNIAVKTLNVLVQQQNGGVYTIRPVSVNLNSSTNPASWTVTPISALPDAQSGQPYNPGAGSYYGLALYQSGVLHMTQNAGNGSPMNFTVRSGAFPSGIVAFSGNSFTGGSDYSGIELFNVSGGANPTVNGSFSFVAEWSNVQTPAGTVTQAVGRSSLTVTPSGGGTTPVDTVVFDASGDFSVNLTSATGTPYPWVFPLVAEGGTGPYTFTVQSGTTLPGAVVTSWNGQPALATTSTARGSFTATVVAIDVNGVTSAPLTIPVTVIQTVTEPVHVVSVQLPTSLFAGRPLPPNTYFIESDLISNFTASGLPTGISISTAPGTKGYLYGTPTSTGNFTATITATSVLYNTSAAHAATIAIAAQTATFVSPPSSAIVNTAYRVVNNNAIVLVQYTGYQPSDPGLPLPTSLNGTLGAPGTVVGGFPTTGVQSVSSTGFILAFDYSNGTIGSDTLTLGSQTASVAITYPVLAATPKTVAATISEYSISGIFAAPVSVSGGSAPYTITYTGFSDPRFAASGQNILATIANFTAGTTTSCQVSMTITDSSSQTVNCVGTVSITVKQETAITVMFGNDTESVNVSAETPFTWSLLPSVKQSTPVLGHAPYQYFIDSVTIPSGIAGFVHTSPSKRVLAIQYNNASTSATISDVNSSLAASGSFVVAATSFASAPTPATYVITLALRVVDSEGISTSQSVNLSLIVS